MKLAIMKISPELRYSAMTVVDFNSEIRVLCDVITNYTFTKINCSISKK